MPTEKQFLESGSGVSTRLFNAIEKVRLQKQRPSAERIHRVLRQLEPDLSLAAVTVELEKAAKDGHILKVVTNDLCSYKLLPASIVKSLKNSLPVLHVLPTRECLDVIVSVVDGLERCSLEVLECQLKRKYTLESAGDSSLRIELRDCCLKLVKLGRLKKDGLYFCMPHREAVCAADSVADGNIWRNATVCLEDCTSSMAMSSTSSLLSDRGKPKTESTCRRGSADGRITRTDELPTEDPYSFQADPVIEAPVKHRQKTLLSAVKPGTRAPSVDQTVLQLNSTRRKSSGGGKSTGNIFSDIREFSSMVKSKSSKELASCDSTTSNLDRGRAHTNKPPGVSLAVDRQPSKPGSSGDWQNDSRERDDSAEKEEGGEKNSEEKPKKRCRNLQLAFLFDSLSGFFTATGEKRSAVQKNTQSLQASANSGMTRSFSRTNCASRPAARGRSRGSEDSRHFEDEAKLSLKKEKPVVLVNSQLCEKPKSIQTKVKRPSATKELFFKQGNQQSKSSGAAEVFISRVTEEESKLFQVVQTIAEERILVDLGSAVPQCELKQPRTQVMFGKFELVSDQHSPYPPEFSVLPRVHVCELCLKCSKTRSMLERHLRKCCPGHPPGDEIYHDGSLSVFEIHGNREPVYCRNLVMFSRLFLDHPGLYCRVSQCIYYVTTINDRNGSHFVGFFSKEKLGGHNLACLLVLPQHQKNGYGHFMVHLSYWLSSTDETAKSPKPPLTDAIRNIYKSVWKQSVIDCIEREDLSELTVRVISCSTGISDDDVFSTLCDLGLKNEMEDRHSVVHLTPALREILLMKTEEKKRPVEFNPNAFLDSRLTRKLRGKPRAPKRNSDARPNSLVVDSIKKRRTENGESRSVEPEAKWKELSDEPDLDFGPSSVGPSKRKVGWPKGLKRGPRKEKSVETATRVIRTRGTGVKARKNVSIKADMEIKGNNFSKDNVQKDLQENEKKIEVEEMDVSTSARLADSEASTPVLLKAQDNDQDDLATDDDLLSDNEGSTLSEMPLLEVKGHLQSSDNELDLGRSPSPPHLEQELLSPYFCSAAYSRHGLDLGSKDAESVLSDCLAGRSVAPSPCFSVDGDPHPTGSKRLTDCDSDSDMSVTSGDKKKSGERVARSVTPCSRRSEAAESNFAASRTTDSSEDEEVSRTSTGFSRSSSVESRTSLRCKSLIAESSPGVLKLSSVASSRSLIDKSSTVESPSSFKENLSSIRSPGSIKGRSVGSPGSVKGIAIESPGSIKGISVGSPGSIKGISVGSPGSVKGISVGSPGSIKGISVGSPGSIKLNSLESPCSIKGLSVESPGSVKDNSVDSVSSIKANSLESPGSIKGHSMESPGSIKGHSLGSPGSVKGHSMESPGSIKGHSINSTGSIKDSFMESPIHMVEGNLEESPVLTTGNSIKSPGSAKCSPAPESPHSLKGKSTLSPYSEVERSSLIRSPGQVKTISVESPSSIIAQSYLMESPSNLQAKKTRGLEERGRGDTSVIGSSLSENWLQKEPGDKHLLFGHMPVVSLASSSLGCSFRNVERHEPDGNSDGVPLHSSHMLRGGQSTAREVSEHLTGDLIMTPRPTSQGSGASHGSIASQGSTASQCSMASQISLTSHDSMASHRYVAGHNSSIPNHSPQANKSFQMMKRANDMSANSSLGQYESSEHGKQDVISISRQHFHQPLPKLGPGLMTTESTPEPSHLTNNPASRTFLGGPILPPSVLTEDRSPRSFQLQNGLPARATKSGTSAANPYSHGGDNTAVSQAANSRAHPARQAMSANSSMLGQCSVAVPSPGFMNSMTQSPMTKGMSSNFATSKSSAMMGNRSSSSRGLNSSQMTAAGGGGGFSHQQMTKQQMMSNKYNKLSPSNVHLQNLSPCGLYSLPKSSPGSAVQQQGGMLNSSPNMNYAAVSNLSPSSSECANASFHSLAAHNRNLVNASPAPSCAGKQSYNRHLQHGTSRGFGGGGSGAPSSSPKPTPSALYQLPPSQTVAPSPHQIQAAPPYMHGASAVQRHINEPFPSGSEPFSHQQGYISTATYLAKLQQLTSDLNPFQTHYAMTLPTNMSPSPIDMTLPSHASPQRNMTPPNIPSQRLGTKQQVHRGNSGGQHKGTSSAAAAGFLPDVAIQPSSDMIARYQLLSGYHVQQPMTCPSFIHQGSPSQIPMQVGVMNVGMHPGQPTPNFMPSVQGQPNSAVYAAYGYINGSLAPQPFNMNLNDLMRR